MTPPNLRHELTAGQGGECQPDARPGLQYLFEEVFVLSPAVKAAVLAGEPFGNDTPPPSGQTMPKPTVEPNVQSTTLHLPPRQPSAAVKQQG